MKRTLIILALLLPIMAITQNITVDQPSIVVYGSHRYDAEIVSYKVTAALSLHEAKFNDSNTNLESLKKEFFTKLSEKGIDASKVVESEMDFIVTGRNGEGTYFTFITSSADEFKKYLSIKLPGIYFEINYFKNKVQGKKPENIVKAALLNAKEKAAKIATGMNKKLGDIILVSEIEPLANENNWSYYLSDPNYRVYVTFGIK
ncbi:MAG: hypothetical protein K0U54_09540 [Bacteroidetes bacterium]|nr:hypothetical protein [Bacteroidota bacterium]